MNPILISAVWGVVMMFSGVFVKQASSVRALAIIGAAIVFISNLLDLNGIHFISHDARPMLAFDTFGLLFNAVAYGCTLIYFLLSGKDIGKVGNHVSEYYALIFFVLSGVAIASSFTSLLMLFLGIEIISIPLYILTATDKRN